MIDGSWMLIVGIIYRSHNVINTTQAGFRNAFNETIQLWFAKPNQMEDLTRLLISSVLILGEPTSFDGA